MFANRRSSQKPAEDFYAAFKQSFPEVGPGTTSAGEGSTGAGRPEQQRSSSLDEAVEDGPPLNRYASSSPVTSLYTPPSGYHVLTIPPTKMDDDDLSEITENEMLTTESFCRQFDNIDGSSKDQDATPKLFTDQWRLTPSLMDPNSFAFSAFANQPPGYYTPTPGGLNTFYHSSAAGDLHTPGMGMNTPLSLPNSIHALHAPDPNMHYPHFNPQMLHHGHSYAEPFQHQQVQQQQQSYAPPSHFLQHQDSGYAAMDDSPHKVTPTGSEHHQMQQNVAPSMQQIDLMGASYHPSSDKYVAPSFEHNAITNNSRFRFHTTLNAPTAMVRSNDEIPITYLNKGQAYTMSIFDTTPPHSYQNVQLKYRTYVRVSFEDEQQRAKPGSCWQLWKEGRGSNEAHQRGGKLLAVEYVDPNQGGDEELRKSNMELERASFDGFAVTWSPSQRCPGAPDCSISVRFNFLSTDFSHSKGVKGIPVRLCAKTELITTTMGQAATEPEVCFSKVKLFRDHGAERKLSNDVAHVKKTIDKLKQQITQAESGMTNIGKRKRSGSMAKPGKLALSKYYTRVPTDLYLEAGKLTAEEDLHMKLMSFQDMFSSTRPLSVLFLKGEPEDDPDLYPVKLPGGDEVKALARITTWESRQSVSDSLSSHGSPTPSNASEPLKRKFSEIQQPFSTDDVEDETKTDQNQNQNQNQSMSPGRSAKKIKHEHEPNSKEILAIDVDDTYQPPKPERVIKPGK